MSKTPEYHEALAALLDRLVQAGMLERYQIPEDEAADPLLVWKPLFHGESGKDSFLGLAVLLQQICPETPLSASDQAMIQLLRQHLFDTE